MRLHLEFDVPDAVSPRAKAAVKRHLREEAVVGLFKRQLCSGGFAAKLLGLTLRQFLSLLKKHGVPYSRGSKSANWLTSGPSSSCGTRNSDRRRSYEQPEGTNEVRQE